MGFPPIRSGWGILAPPGREFAAPGPARVPAPLRRDQLLTTATIWKRVKRAYRAALDRPHERRLGIRTSLVTPGLSNIEAQIQGHMGTPYRALDAIGKHMTGNGIAVPRFVDIGCGLGRPLYYFADRFEDLQGFEIVMSLHSRAQAQLDAVRTSNPAYARIAIHHADATAALPLDRPMVLFLYNPFGPKPMARLCERLRAAEQEIHLYYVLPMLAEQLAAALGRAADARLHAAHDILYFQIAPKVENPIGCLITSEGL